MKGPKTDPRKRTIFYQYRADRAKRTLKGIDQQIAKAEKVVAGQAAVKRNWFVQLTGGTKAVNRDLEDKARVGRVEGYVTNLEGPTGGVRAGCLPPAVADREQLPECPRVIYEPGRSTTTNATPSRPPHHRGGRPRRQPLARTPDRLVDQETREDPLRRYRSIAVQTGDHILHAGTPLDDDTRAAVSAVRNTAAGH